ncbi:MAG: RiPP maturation radical SAM C-methyltransferase [Nevskia sp.]|jgi:ribosomal peptide maturation radical SAM protein 1|nr:RiPP maturation radical SAM C-methyltransferase [Nevskia sp.]
MKTSSGEALDVCLVVPPFDSLTYPPLGTAVLASSLKARGLKCRNFYGSIQLAARVGVEKYHEICRVSPRAMAGERLFVPYAYSADMQDNLGDAQPLPPPLLATYDAVQREIPAFLEALTTMILACRPRIVGISSNFQQNMAAFSIARAIKLRAPDICVVLGGANLADPMGGALLTVFPWVDHIFSGEADIAFPDFCSDFIHHDKHAASKLIKCAPITKMDVVASPDFSDYFETLRGYQKIGALPNHLPGFVALETSRGCWWGQKHHCTFCGLNGDGMEFRAKPAARVIAEIREAVEKWGASYLHFADNIMPMGFLTSVFPVTAMMPNRPKMFFEVKANLRDEQLAIMADGGVDSVQPGIESLSSNLLKLMRKGVSAAQNIALMRNCRARNITLGWNLLCGFPGEQAEDYEAMLELMPKLVHLQAPNTLSKVIFDRYSPYHANHRDFGVEEIVPYQNYFGLYPRGAPVVDIAYHFDGNYTTPLLSNVPLFQRLQKDVASWRVRWLRRGTRPVLTIASTDSGEQEIIDTRQMDIRLQYVLSEKADAALRYFERPRPRLGDHVGHEAYLPWLLERDLVIDYEDQLMSVVVRPTISVHISSVANPYNRQTVDIALLERA